MLTSIIDWENNTQSAECPHFVHNVKAVIHFHPLHTYLNQTRYKIRKIQESFEQTYYRMSLDANHYRPLIIQYTKLKNNRSRVYLNNCQNKKNSYVGSQMLCVGRARSIVWADSVQFMSYTVYSVQTSCIHQHLKLFQKLKMTTITHHSASQSRSLSGFLKV